MPRPPASPLAEEDKIGKLETNDGHQLTDSQSKPHSSGKHAKKTKKHSKLDQLPNQSGDVEVIVGKPKRHKKSSGEKPTSLTPATASYPSPTGDSSDVAAGAKRAETDAVLAEEEPVKKKKKRSKDHQPKTEKVKSKKSSADAAVVVSGETYAVETTSKVKESHRSKDRKKDTKESEKLPASSTSVRKHQLSAESPPECENERCQHHLTSTTHDESFRPISPEEPQHEHYASPRHSSPSSRFSSAHSNSSSYSRSPSHRAPERRNDAVRSYRERGRGPRSRAPERSRSPDPRHFCPRRTYVAYHPHASHSRDSSSFEDYSHDPRQTRFRRSRSRSHGSSRPSHYDVPNHDYDPPQSTNRARMPSPRRTYSQRHYREDHDRRRESPRRPPLRRERYHEERHAKHEVFSSDARRGPRPYRSHERPHDTAFTSPEPAPIHVHGDSRRDNSADRSRHREDRRSPVEDDRRAFQKDRSRASPPKVSKRQPIRSEHHSRDEKDHRLSETKKSERPHRRSSVSQDRQSTGRTTPPDSSTTHATSNGSETSRRKPSSASKSPRRTKSNSAQPRKSQSSSSSSASKLRPVLDHLDQLQFENVSDTELEVILTPTSFLTNAQVIESHAKEIEFRGGPQQSSTELNQDESGNGLPTTTDTIVDASKPNDTLADQSNTLVLDTLDQISSQLRQKLSGPETWDSCAPGSESESDELDDVLGVDLDTAMRDPSVIGMTTTRVSTTRSRQLTTASFITPWQQLIESASKAQESSRQEEMPDEAFKPAVCIGNPLGANSGLFPCRLVPLQQRASGAIALSQIGVSARYLGPELLDCLNKELSRVSHEQTTEGQKLSEFEARPVAWMHRTRDVLSCGQELPKDWLDSCLTFGVLSRKSDALMRQYLIQSTG